MRYYSKITIWENQKRIVKLSEFRNLCTSYFNNSRFEWMAEGRIEQEEAQSARVEINRLMYEVHNIILASGIIPSLQWTPPPAVGGYIQNVNLILNIFQLHQFQIPPDNLMDYIDRSIGIYQSNRKKAIARTLNPFFYIGLLIDFIVEIPFSILGRFGFNKEKAESSFVGRLAKGFLYLITVAASLLTILQLLDYLTPVREFVRHIVGSK